METFEPAPFLIVDDAQQIKAFTDPLRVRVLVVLAERATTNQQLADLLGEPQAKVLYHLRFLLHAGLIVLVEQRIKGGNVEKYYRATARSYGLRPSPELNRDIAGVVSAELAIMGQELAASAARWPDDRQHFVAKSRRMAPERAQSFFARLEALVREYWDTSELEPVAEPLYNVGCVLYRNPRVSEPPEMTSGTERDAG